MALKIVMFSDFVCPFCYIGLEVMRKLRPEFDFELQWRGFQIHPEWPAEGMPASEFHRAMDPDTRRAIWARIQAMAAEAGLTMKPPAVLCNSRMALEAAEFAAEHGKAEAFEQQVYRAYFQEGANIGDRKTLTKLAAEAGINSDQLDEAWSSGKYTLKLKNNALMAHHRGVSGVPTFFIGEFPLVGAQSEDVVRQMLKRASDRLEAVK